MVIKARGTLYHPPLLRIGAIHLGEGTFKETDVVTFQGKSAQEGEKRMFQLAEGKTVALVDFAGHRSGTYAIPEGVYARIGRQLISGQHTGELKDKKTYEFGVEGNKNGGRLEVQWRVEDTFEKNFWQRIK